MSSGPLRILGIEAEPLSVPLREPFVIASGRLDATRAALVRVELEDPGTGRRAQGLGEAAALPPVTQEDQPDLVEAIASAGAAATGDILAEPSVSGSFAELGPVARCGVEAALLDAAGRLWQRPAHDLLAPGSMAVDLVTDITIPIGRRERMVELAVAYRQAGFECFKVKVGKDPSHDRAALEAMAKAVPDARFRLDANEGFDAPTALRLVDGLLAKGVGIELFEQPCRRADLDGMAEVTARCAVPVVADESVRSEADLARLVDAGAAHAVNLKLAKMGGPVATLRLAQRAREAGLRLMAGAMVETRLGLSAMAHVVCALGGVDWVDLDTAYLLAEELFDGGYVAEGPALRLVPGAGHTVVLGTASG